jgi:hypothetical protein
MFGVLKIMENNLQCTYCDLKYYKKHSKCHANKFEWNIVIL